MNKESLNLLKKCNSGCKNGTNSMEQILDFVRDEKLKRTIKEYDKRHIEIGDECHELLNRYGCNEEDPKKISAVVAWFGTEVKLAIDDSTEKIADLLVDGCVMGIKSLYKEINSNKGAESKIKDIAMELVSIEQDFMNELLGYL